MGDEVMQMEALMRRGGDQRLPHSLPWEDSGEGGCLQTGKWAPTLILDAPAPRTVGDRCVWLKPAPCISS